MPSFDLRGIKAAKYNNNNGVVSYSDAVSIGDAMDVNIQFRFAEGRLYAEGSLAEYMRSVTGGSISIAVKDIPNAAQTMLYGARLKKRTVGQNEIPGRAYGANDISEDVGVAFYAPDRIDGVTKYTCCFVHRALFGPPDLVYKTKGETIVFNTPTTTGEFMPDHSADKDVVEVATVDTAEVAAAWVNAVLGGAAAPASPVEGEGSGEG